MGTLCQNTRKLSLYDWTMSISLVILKAHLLHFNDLYSSTNISRSVPQTQEQVSAYGRLKAGDRDRVIPKQRCRTWVDHLALDLYRRGEILLRVLITRVGDLG